MYAAKWASTMEARMGAGEKLEDIAEQVSRDVDTLGMSGATYGIAKNCLIQCWKHGDELKAALDGAYAKREAQWKAEREAREALEKAKYLARDGVDAHENQAATDDETQDDVQPDDQDDAYRRLA